MIMPLFKAEYPEFQFKNPGMENIQVSTPGKYYLWNDYQTFFEGQSFSTSKQLPNGTKVTVIDSVSGKELTFNPDASISISVGNNAQTSIGYVEISGPQSLSVQIESNEERVFTFAQSRFMKIISTVAGAIVLSAILTLSGIGALIWGLVRMTSKEKKVQS